MTGTDSNEGGSNRKRRPASIDYRLKVEAIRVVDPIVERLALWSPRVVYLRAIANRTGIGAAILATGLAEAQALLDEIRAARSELAGLIQDLPPELSSHGRIRDAQRSLNALEMHLSEALLLLAR